MLQLHNRQGCIRKKVKLLDTQLLDNGKYSMVNVLLLLGSLISIKETTLISHTMPYHYQSVYVYAYSIYIYIYIHIYIYIYTYAYVYENICVKDPTTPTHRFCGT